MAQSVDDRSDRLITVRETARILGVAEVTVRRLAARGELPVVRLSGLRAIRFPRVAVCREAGVADNLREAFQLCRGSLDDAQVAAIDDNPASVERALAMRSPRRGPRSHQERGRRVSRPASIPMSPETGARLSPAIGDELLRWPAVRARVALSRTSIWRKVRAGSFPPPVRVSDNAIAWRARDVALWIATRPDASGHPRERDGE